MEDRTDALNTVGRASIILLFEYLRMMLAAVGGRLNAAVCLHVDDNVITANRAIASFMVN